MQVTSPDISGFNTRNVTLISEPNAAHLRTCDISVQRDLDWPRKIYV